MSKRQQIVDAIKTRLQGILTVNGYNSNLGSNVFEWRTQTISASSLPALAFRDISANRVEDGPIGIFRWSLNMELEIVAESGSSTPAEIRKMIADAYKVIGVDPKWGDLAQFTAQPESDEMQFEQSEKIIGGASIKFSIVYDTPKWEN